MAQCRRYYTTSGVREPPFHWDAGFVLVLEEENGDT